MLDRSNETASEIFSTDGPGLIDLEAMELG